MKRLALQRPVASYVARLYLSICLLFWDTKSQVASDSLPHSKSSYELQWVRTKPRAMLLPPSKELAALLLQHAAFHSHKFLIPRREHAKPVSLNYLEPVRTPQRHPLRADISMLDSSSLQLKKAWNPIQLWKAAGLLCDKDLLPDSEEPASVGTVFLTLTSPGLISNPFMETRFQPNVYIAEDEQGNVAGVVQTVLANLERKGGLATVRFIQNVAVAPIWQRKGVATNLLKFVFADDPRYQNVLSVYPDNEPAISLYGNFGFVRDEDEPERDGVMLMVQEQQES